MPAQESIVFRVLSPADFRMIANEDGRVFFDDHAADEDVKNLLTAYTRHRPYIERRAPPNGGGGDCFWKKLLLLMTPVLLLGVGLRVIYQDWKDSGSPPLIHLEIRPSLFGEGGWLKRKK